jgi:hypothetical protein
MEDDEATGATRCATCGATDGFKKRPRVAGQNGNPVASAVGAAPVEKLFTWRCGRCGQDFETAVFVPDRSAV